MSDPVVVAMGYKKVGTRAPRQRRPSKLKKDDNSDGDALRHVAETVWHSNHSSDCPDWAVPSVADITELVSSIDWFLPELLDPETPHADTAIATARAERATTHRLEKLYHSSVARLLVVHPPRDVCAFITDPKPFFVSLADIHANVLAAVQKNPDNRPLHPLVPLVRVWQTYHAHQPIERETRPDRIMPLGLARASESHTRSGRLAAFWQPSQGQLVLPEIGHRTEGIALPLHLYELGVANEAERRGRAAPLALRLWVEGVLNVPFAARTGDWPTVHRITLRDLLAVLYPGRRRPRPSEYGPRLEAAVAALDSHAARVEWENPTTGQGGLRRVVSITDLPRPGHLDDTLAIVVHLPPGAQHGPIVTPNLGMIGVRSARQYKVMIGLAYRWFEPGRTHAPKGRGRNRRWLPRRTGHRPITDTELVSLCFPGREHRPGTVAFRKQIERSRRDIATLEAQGELVMLNTSNGPLILPPNTATSSPTASERH